LKWFSVSDIGHVAIFGWTAGTGNVFSLNQTQPSVEHFRPYSGCACRKSNAHILAVQPAENWAAKNLPGPFDGSRERRILLQGEFKILFASKFRQKKSKVELRTSNRQS
jgi:hypothetical protein